MATRKKKLPAALPQTHNPVQKPRGYHVQTHIECCATCRFGGYLGEVDQVERMCICEINGEVEGSNYWEVAAEPLGKCEAFKPRLRSEFHERK